MNMVWEPFQCSVTSGTFMEAGQPGGVSAGLEFPGNCLLRQRNSQCSRLTYGSLEQGLGREMLRRSLDQG